MIMWIIGLSGSGKTTLGEEIIRVLKEKEKKAALVDGDVVRQIINQDIGYDQQSRRQNARRISNLCKFLEMQNIDVVACVLSISEADRSWNRENFENYFEVFIQAPMTTLQLRDSKGLYSSFLEGKITNVVGMDIEFEPPLRPDLVILNYESDALPEFLSYADDLASNFR